MNSEYISIDKPVLFLSNHQNALLDALIIATKCHRFSYFLSRASVFKKPLVSILLKSFRMLPVYRIRDGWNTIANNKSVFNSCMGLLVKNESVAIFPEGNHNLKRTVRPLSKGFTRIVFDTLEKYPTLDLQLIPIGLNYRNSDTFVDEVTMYVGKPICAKDYVLENRSEGVIKLKEDVHRTITKLTTHIPLEIYDETIKRLEDLKVDFLNPISVNECISNNFEDCNCQKKQNLAWVKSLLKGLLIVNLIIPYLTWKFLIRPKIKEPEFISTFRFVIAITLVPIYLLVLVIVINVLFGWVIGISYFISTLLLALLAVKF